MDKIKNLDNLNPDNRVLSVFSVIHNQFDSESEAEETESGTLTSESELSEIETCKARDQESKVDSSDSENNSALNTTVDSS